VYVVTVQPHEERQENTRTELGDGNFEFVFGIDQRQFTKEQLIKDGVYDERLARELDPKGRDMTLAQICCTHTHLQIYKDMLEKGVERALIFEDDLRTIPFSEQEMSDAISNLPADFDVILWGWFGGRFRPPLGALQQAIFHVKHFLGLYKFNHRMIRNVYMRPYNAYFNVGAVNYGTYAYTVTRSGAEKLITLNTPIAHICDHVTIYGALRGELKMYVSTRQFFGNRSVDPEDPLESRVPRFS
jgi:GR25 family glycosyltransferase involved in LPS biosynthesis